METGHEESEEFLLNNSMPEKEPIHDQSLDLPISKSEQPDIPELEKRKRQKKDMAYWKDTLEERKSTRERKPWVLAIGVDPDRPTDEQAQSSPQAAE